MGGERASCSRKSESLEEYLELKLPVGLPEEKSEVAEKIEDVPEKSKKQKKSLSRTGR